MRAETVSEIGKLCAKKLFTAEIAEKSRRERKVSRLLLVFLRALCFTSLRSLRSKAVRMPTTQSACLVEVPLRGILARSGARNRRATSECAVHLSIAAPARRDDVS